MNNTQAVIRACHSVAREIRRVVVAALSYDQPFCVLVMDLRDRSALALWSEYATEEKIISEHVAGPFHVIAMSTTDAIRLLAPPDRGATHPLADFATAISNALWEPSEIPLVTIGSGNALLGSVAMSAQKVTLQ